MICVLDCSEVCLQFLILSIPLTATQTYLKVFRFQIIPWVPSLLRIIEGLILNKTDLKITLKGIQRDF